MRKIRKKLLDDLVKKMRSPGAMIFFKDYFGLFFPYSNKSVPFFGANVEGTLCNGFVYGAVIF